MKNVLETFAYVIGPILLLLGLGSLVLFCIISFNDSSVAFIEIIGSLIATILGWVMTMFANKTKKASLLQIILDFLF